MGIDDGERRTISRGLRLRRWATALSAPLVAAGLLFSAPPVALAEAVRITFLHINDVYEISAKDGRGGFAELMTLLEAERAAAEHSITTFGGDLLSPSVMSGLTRGAHMIELMNALGADVAVTGNHEFDFGPDVLARRIEEAEFPWLAANVLGRDGRPALGLAATHALEAGGYTVGFFGVVTPQTAVMSAPGAEVDFVPVIGAARAAVERLRAAGADLIVALTHQDLKDDRELARSVEGIHLILGGHDHDPVTFFENGVMIHKSGTNAHYLGAIDLTIERVEKPDGAVLRALPAWRMLPTAGVPPDAAIRRIVERHNARLSAELNTAIGKTSIALDSRRSTVRARESSFGNLVAEAMREAVGAEVGLIGGGGIRGDRLYEAGTTLTRGDIMTELPFGDVTVLIELSGADLLAALENSVSEVERGSGRFLQMAGMTMVYDPSAARGKRVIEARVGGVPLDESRRYRVATTDYLYRGGDGFAGLSRGRALIGAAGGALTATLVIDYIAARGVVAPRTDGRIAATAGSKTSPESQPSASAP